MSYVIHKHQLGVSLTLQLPAGAKVVHYGNQDNVPTFWVHQPEGEPARYVRTFQTFATGEPIPDHARYIGTAQFPGAGYKGAGLVWHLFEVTPPFR